MMIPTYEAKLIESLDRQELAAKLDQSCKAIVASRQVLAHILQAVIPEYESSTIEDILPLIGKVAIGEENVHRDEAPKHLSSKVDGEQQRTAPLPKAQDTTI